MENNDVSPRLTLIAFAILIVVMVVSIVLLVLAQPKPIEIVINPPVPTGTPLPSSTPAPIQVYVTGAVNQPQVTLELPAGSRVQDAIDAAGGLTDDADLERVNLAGILRDGDQIHVAVLSTDTDIALPTPSGDGVVYINSATQAELETLPGIGPVTAQAILEYRDTNGAFASLEELDQVPGIGASTLEALATLISFE